MHPYSKLEIIKIIRKFFFVFAVELMNFALEEV